MATCTLQLSVELSVLFLTVLVDFVSVDQSGEGNLEEMEMQATIIQITDDDGGQQLIVAAATAHRRRRHGRSKVRSAISLGLNIS